MSESRVTLYDKTPTSWLGGDSVALRPVASNQTGNGKVVAIVASLPAIGITPNPQAHSQFVRVLTRHLGFSLVEEMELTVRVAVYTAGGLTRAEIVRRLDSSDMEVKMALERLRRISEHWK